MIDDMLFLAKADNGLIVPDAKPVALEALCAQLLDYYQLSADERGVRFELSGAGTIQGDLLMLRRAPSNLLSNALRYTPTASGSGWPSSGAGQVTLDVSNPARPSLPSIWSGCSTASTGSTRHVVKAARVTPGWAGDHPFHHPAHRGDISRRSEQGWTTFCLQFPV